MSKCYTYFKNDIKKYKVQMHLPKQKQKHVKYNVNEDVITGLSKICRVTIFKAVNYSDPNSHF